MASLLFKEGSNTEAGLSPESIMQTLFTYRDTAHKYHLNCFSRANNTGSHAEHLALDELYKGIQKKQDAILEQIMGYTMRPINSPTTKITAPKYTNTQDSIELCTSIIEFAGRLIDYASKNKFHNIENIAQDLSGLAAETRYFLMFK